MMVIEELNPNNPKANQNQERNSTPGNQQRQNSESSRGETGIDVQDHLENEESANGDSNGNRKTGQSQSKEGQSQNTNQNNNRGNM